MSRTILSVEADLTPSVIAAAFCDMNDEEQSQFFVEVAKVMATWKPGAREMQTYGLAKHLADCVCSSDDAREFVREIGSRIR